MREIDDKIYYSWKDYNEDMYDISLLEFDHVVGIYRGSLGMATHVSNLHDVPMSIIGMQSRDSDDKEPYWIHNLIDKDTKRVLIVDDIYDTGYTMKKVVNHCLLYSCWDCDVISYCLFGKSKDKDKIFYSQEHDGSWIVFPWETLDAPI